MPESTVEFTTGDLLEIPALLIDMADATLDRAGDDGAGLTRLLMGLADSVAGWWVAADEGRVAEPVRVPPMALAGDDAEVLGDAAERVAEMMEDPEIAGDAPWLKILGLVRGSILVELETRRGTEN